MFRPVAFFVLLAVPQQAAAQSWEADLVEKAEKIVVSASFDQGLPDLLALTLTRTQTYSMVMVECSIRGRRLKRNGIRLAVEEHSPDWRRVLATQVLEAFGRGFVKQADLSDSAELNRLLREHSEFDTYLDKLEPALKPILVEATTTSLAYMYRECFD